MTRVKMQYCVNYCRDKAVDSCGTKRLNYCKSNHKNFRHSYQKNSFNKLFFLCFVLFCFHEQNAK